MIFDLFGSRDGEGLAWLRSPLVKDKKVLLLKGPNVDVDSSFPCKSVENVSLDDINRSDLVISSSPLYLSPDHEFFFAAKLTDLLYKRFHWNRLIFLVCREAANLFYSRLKISENQLDSKSQMIYMIREARHMGVALGLDSVRFYAVDIDIRNLSDYIILKSQGIQGLASDMRWLYSFFNPSVIRDMKQKYFIMLTRKGGLGLGEFPCPPWHKSEKEDILAACGLKVEYGEQVELGKSRGAFKTIGDSEHVRIIELYQSNNSMEKVATELNRSRASIFSQIHSHDDAVKRSGFCPKCRRARGKSEGSAIMKEVEEAMR